MINFVEVRFHFNCHTINYFSFFAIGCMHLQREKNHTMLHFSTSLGILGITHGQSDSQAPRFKTQTVNLAMWDLVL